MLAAWAFQGLHVPKAAKRAPGVAKSHRDARRHLVDRAQIQLWEQGPGSSRRANWPRFPWNAHAGSTPVVYVISARRSRARPASWRIRGGAIRRVDRTTNGRFRAGRRAGVAWPRGDSVLARAWHGMKSAGRVGRSASLTAEISRSLSWELRTSRRLPAWVPGTSKGRFGAPRNAGGSIVGQFIPAQA